MRRVEPIRHFDGIIAYTLHESSLLTLDANGLKHSKNSNAIRAFCQLLTSETADFA